MSVSAAGRVADPTETHHENAEGRVHQGKPLVTGCA